MMRKRSRTTLVAVAVLTVAGGAAAVAATREDDATSLPGLSAADRRAIQGFERWTPLTKPPLASLRSLGSAHPGTKRIYASPPRSRLVRAGRQRFPYPVGTRIVKTGSTGGVVTLVAIMRKVARGGASDGGWDYVEYSRSSGTARFSRVSFPERGCAGCHVNANTRQRTDWVFYSLR
jgi:hypothetical protein